MRTLFFTFVLMYLISYLPAQSPYLEIGFRMGGSNYLGDLTPSSFLTSIGETGIHTGIFGLFHFNEHLSFRGGLNFGYIGANDSRSLGIDGARKRRNLSFRSNIAEVELGAQWNLLPYRPLHSNKRFSPYSFLGIAVFRFNPQAFYDGHWLNLQPLGTEGQGLPGYQIKYKLTQVCVPFGLGIKYAVNDNLNITVEYGFRKTFTDYLDDTSGRYPDLKELKEERGELAWKLSWRTDEILPDAAPPRPGTLRGDPNDLDWYVFSSFAISYNLGSGKTYRPSGRGRKSTVRCPEWKRK